jgi:hypothetical protein
VEREGYAEIVVRGTIAETSTTVIEELHQRTKRIDVHLSADPRWVGFQPGLIHHGMSVKQTPYSYALRRQEAIREFYGSLPRLRTR